ncbi:MAG: hypothetical protein LC772_08715, partial [Chloroflexi bacterium]|nr:hypothetical protein [Chloroflexota bacterium]
AQALPLSTDHPGRRGQKINLKAAELAIYTTIDDPDHAQDALKDLVEYSQQVPLDRSLLLIGVRSIMRHPEELDDYNAYFLRWLLFQVWGELAAADHFTPADNKQALGEIATWVKSLDSQLQRPGRPPGLTKRRRQKPHPAA